MNIFLASSDWLSQDGICFGRSVNLLSFGMIPAFTWLRAYKGSWLRGDFLAGITLAAYLLPAALGDASLANLPPEAGLYACLFCGLVFWIFCGSRPDVTSLNCMRGSGHILK